MDRDSLKKDYIELVASVREYVEEQLQLGFKESELSEPEQESPYANFDLTALATDAASCTKCPLHETRNSVVFGVGNTDADLMFIGEAPGADEDRQGEPFVGRAGQLLTQIIEGGMKLKREDVYIANVLKCRPPGNRNPEPVEVETCNPYLVRQIELIQPKVIIALGSFAAQMLLGTKIGITKLRGEFHACKVAGLRVLPHKKPPVVMPTFHPAYLLRNPNAKADVWEDIKKVLAFLADV
ncbi:Type-4 uracil-DNA glycosylase [Geodia barretti]|uniref:Type-4 uracil-DNA glycosylase n=1 Tax=Geodia barretti TaxID=519541 RepID=A0AA35R379_GEOBA|nr:Type-4 uracil-DNA glycosylase [Geodia barretti]